MRIAQVRLLVTVEMELEDDEVLQAAEDSAKALIQNGFDSGFEPFDKLTITAVSTEER